MEKKEYTEIKNCRVCNGSNLKPYLNLGEIPLVNNFLSSEKDIKNELKYPLIVNLCKDCYFSQLSGIVDPEILFKNYVYRSSISASFGKHCEELAENLNKSVLNKNDLVVDIASNDGYLLSFFKNKGNRVLGVDPAENLAEIANEKGIETIPKFWNKELAKNILEKYGPAKIITAFNVFAHVPDLHSFVEGVRILLDKGGYFIIESPHLAELISKSEFDTVYHEHASYLLIKPLVKLMNDHELRIARVTKEDVHGGSIRVYIELRDSPDTSNGSLNRIVEEEEKQGLFSETPYDKLQKGSLIIRKNLIELLNKLNSEGKKVYGFGASAKGNILLNFCKIGPDLIKGIFDDTPEKQGKFYPGVHIPVMSRSFIKEINPDYLLLLPWNFKEELISKTKDFKEKGGKYIIPLPNIEII
jgi:SAM-dependent methyltransferase